MRKLDIVSPVFNEEDVIHLFHERLVPIVLHLEQDGWDVRIVYINDCSTDDTLPRLLAFSQPGGPKVDVISTSRNSGHQAAIWLGIAHARKECCVLAIDADLQDPPEVILEMAVEIQSHDVVLTKRNSRVDRFWKVFNARLFYRLVSYLSDGLLQPQVGDFWMLGEAATERLREGYQERHIFIRGLVQDLGLRRGVVHYDRASRGAGDTHYTLARMTHLAIAGVAGFTIKPLVYVAYLALASVIFASIAVGGFVFGHLAGLVDFAPGVGLSLVVLLALAVSMHLSIAVLAVYIAKISIETTRRPAVAASLGSAEKSGAEL